MLRKLKNFGHLLEAIIAAFYYRFPARKLVIVGVTGTDGKTTTTNLIYHILTEAGIKTAVLSTLSSAHTTTPDSWRLQKFLTQSLHNKCTHVVLEVSSHAIDQYRIFGTNFAVGVLTNIADNEHLDYHKTFEKYKNIKLKFLQSCEKTVQWEDFKKYRFETKLVGEFNRQNCLAAIGVAKALGIDDENIRKAVASFKSLPGRLEVVVRKPFTVIVDFAHTPQAFEKVLPEVKKMGKRLIHVFGCTGDRDRGKRPIMGAIAAKFDDVIILTHEDTYLEDPGEIVNQIKSGIKEKTPIILLDRRLAIGKALELAKSGDVVLLTGVGHQKSMNIGGHEVPWSEQKVVLELLQNAQKK